jgi:hypothetical protein
MCAFALLPEPAPFPQRLGYAESTPIPFGVFIVSGSDPAAPPTAPPGSAEPDSCQQFAETLAEFDQIATELHYQQAIQVVQTLIARLDLSPRERSGLGDEIQKLEALQHKLTHGVIQLAIFGLVGRGKSSILNALVGQPVFDTGPLHGVTQQSASIPWSEPTRATFPGLGEARIELIDTPGLEEVNGEVRQQIAEQVARQSDLILFVITSDLTQVEYDALRQLCAAKKPILLVFNKIDQYRPSDQQLILEQVRIQMATLPLSPTEIVACAAAPLLSRMVQQGEQRQLQRYRGPAQVDDLKLRILEILDREGKSLLALNSLLYADTLNEQIVARKLAIRRHRAEEAIWKGVLTKAVAVALNPILVADLVGGAAIDIVIILTLSRLYGLPMTQQGALALLKTIALALGGISASELLVTLGLGSLKSLLGASTLATGGLTLAPYVSVAITQAAVAGVSTYLIGQITQTYLAQGASWGPAGPKAVIAEILAEVDETSLMARIKTELRQQIPRAGSS